YICESILAQLAFIPIYVLVVTIIIEQFIEKKDKESMLSKLNVIIGVFLNEMGREILKEFSTVDNNFSNLKDKLEFTQDNFNTQYKDAIKFLKKYQGNFECNSNNLSKLKDYIISKKQVLLIMMENPNLMENDSFTELMLALFHLYEELCHRDDFTKLSKSDLNHLALDVNRAYILLLNEWLHYLKHIDEKYPYLFSLEIRINPFSSENKAELKD
ncbi:MAG: hypothetical protein Q8900_14050, partial [Bacillota bacterium]|nr:hypothetical protein [Bacillota bacterium]